MYWFMKTLQECMGPCVWKDLLCISLNEMMSIYSLLVSLSLLFCNPCMPHLSLSPVPLSMYLCMHSAGLHLPN